MNKITRSVSFVSPVYNDMKSALHILPELVRLAGADFSDWEILLADDASTDGSREWVKRYARGNRHIRVIVHGHNQGIAKTYRQLYAKANNDVIVLFSLDGEWDPADAITLATTLIRDNSDIVVGVRRKKSYSFWRSVVSAVYNIMTRVVFGFATKDAGSIKAMTKDAVTRIPILSRGVFDEAERLIRAHALGYRIDFINVHHRSTKKPKRGIRLFHVAEALVDCIRVYADIYRW
jgi:glycosyltransferase involved in cell wall biosynthesis